MSGLGFSILTQLPISESDRYLINANLFNGYHYFSITVR